MYDKEGLYLVLNQVRFFRINMVFFSYFFFDREYSFFDEERVFFNFLSIKKIKAAQPSHLC